MIKAPQKAYIFLSDIESAQRFSIGHNWRIHSKLTLKFMWMNINYWYKMTSLIADNNVKRVHTDRGPNGTLWFHDFLNIRFKFWSVTFISTRIAARAIVQFQADLRHWTGVSQTQTIDLFNICTCPFGLAKKVLSEKSALLSSDFNFRLKIFLWIFLWHSIRTSVFSNVFGVYMVLKLILAPASL